MTAQRGDTVRVLVGELEGQTGKVIDDYGDEGVLVYFEDGPPDERSLFYRHAEVTALPESEDPQP